MDLFEWMEFFKPGKRSHELLRGTKTSSRMYLSEDDRSQMKNLLHRAHNIAKVRVLGRCVVREACGIAAAFHCCQRVSCVLLVGHPLQQITLQWSLQPLFFHCSLSHLCIAPSFRPQIAGEVGVRVMVDAEQTYYQDAIRHIAVNELMPVYNRSTPAVYNTIQCYLKVCVYREASCYTPTMHSVIFHCI